MGKGSYRGGSTIVRPGSNWFSFEEPESLALPKVDRQETFKQKFQQELAVLQAKDPPDTPSASHEAQARRRELARQKKIERQRKLGERTTPTKEEQQALGERRRWEKIQKKFSELDTKLFRKPTE